MPARTKLKRALEAIDDAKRRLIRLKNNVEDDTDIRRAISELDDAESEIERAIRDIRREE